MIKSFALTAALLGAGWSLGYHSDVVLDKTGELGTTLVAEVGDVVSFFVYDPREAALRCMDENWGNLQICAGHARAWAARDGEHVVKVEFFKRALNTLGDE